MAVILGVNVAANREPYLIGCVIRGIYLVSNVGKHHLLVLDVNYGTSIKLVVRI